MFKLVFHGQMGENSPKETVFGGITEPRITPRTVLDMKPKQATHRVWRFASDKPASEFGLVLAVITETDQLRDIAGTPVPVFRVTTGPQTVAFYGLCDVFPDDGKPYHYHPPVEEAPE